MLTMVACVFVVVVVVVLMARDGSNEAEPTATVDEDDADAVDQATLKAREWENWKDENPKGAGNTMGRK
jgi:hypothetical protein